MHSDPDTCDLLVIGGGINGVGIANDAAGRGLSVLLCEQDDLAAHTSSASSKLIHGGLRYLEHFAFRLVREALGEREILLAKAPHIIWPLRFVLPHERHLRPWWMLRAGLFIYDHLGQRVRLPGSRAVKLAEDNPLRPDLLRAFEYSDCWVDDARLVVLNAMQAHAVGASILPRTRCIAARREGAWWQVTLQTASGLREVRARGLVNAAGPWAAKVIEDALDLPSPHALRLVQGSHIVLPRLYAGDQAYILQNVDQRIVFVLPYEDDFTLVGTTDRDYRGDPAEVKPTRDEEDYLLAVIGHYFRQTVDRQQIQHSYAGVRPLLDDDDSNPAAVTRDYTLSVQGQPDQPPLLSVFGGKLTTYRRLAESALAHLQPWFGQMGPAWTAKQPLPGGDFASPLALEQELEEAFPWLTQAQRRRFVRSYGRLCWRFLAEARSAADLGEMFGAGLTAAELGYLCRDEWAQSVDDVLWRRSKLGLHLNAVEQARVAEWMQENAPADS
ncbi:homodimeric glycerol 3-phosphate dehydrogenase (quinone) [Halopseudomonas salegens]|uniref:Glycerol-3-phosphate dehydrogenase n=2 Tax=Halopseudomonas salegens TaxID=1434072 RepID=A0A1H2FVM3_9GAMM|nr:homodimeric glycerol 3-phosphate dehydrogenase (quinone) [Halopseudomonas salegens]